MPLASTCSRNRCPLEGQGLASNEQLLLQEAEAPKQANEKQCPSFACFPYVMVSWDQVGWDPLDIILARVPNPWKEPWDGESPVVLQVKQIHLRIPTHSFWNLLPSCPVDKIWWQGSLQESAWNWKHPTSLDSNFRALCEISPSSAGSSSKADARKGQEECVGRGRLTPGPSIWLAHLCRLAAYRRNVFGSPIWISHFSPPIVGEANTSPGWLPLESILHFPLLPTLLNSYHLLQILHNMSLHRAFGLNVPNPVELNDAGRAAHIQVTILIQSHSQEPSI